MIFYHLLTPTMIYLGNMLHTAEPPMLVFCRAFQTALEHVQLVTMNLELRRRK
jgi:hypothetical protein